MVRRYIMCLHKLKRHNMLVIKPKLPVRFIEITTENVNLVQNIRGFKYVNLFRNYLKEGSYGIYACVDEKIVGYGWLKNHNSKDTFYRIGEEQCYLGSFFVDNQYRGNSIYPAIINQLIAMSNYDEYYIAAYDNNNSSLHGMAKVGFLLERRDSFVRFAKMTFF